MQCKTCGYRLWNLRSRRCPECGKSFVPSEFDFTPNSTRFICPHCEQDYYGTAPNGHLTPSHFDCVRCGQHIDMDEMILLPAEGVDESQTRADVVPWLDRSSRGLFKAWFGTVGQAMVAPAQLIRAAPGERESADAWWFAIVTSIPIMVLGGSLFMVPFFGAMLAGATGGGGPPVAALCLGFACTLVVAVLMTAVQIAIWGGITHGILRLSGSVRGTITGTYQALCYASGANILTGIPCFGPYIGWIWWVVSAIIMIKEAQEVSVGRAVLAVLTAPALTIFGIITLYAVFLAAVISGTGPFATTFRGGATETRRMIDGLGAYMADYDEPPAHAVELIYHDYLADHEFVLRKSPTLPQHIKAGSTTLHQFDRLDAESQRKVVEDMIAGLPDDTVAYRLGDFVFFDTSNLLAAALPPDLWLVAACADPDGGKHRNQSVSTNGPLHIGLADGSITHVLSHNVPAELTRQNEVRRLVGLPRIPDPRTTRAGQPAVSNP